MTLRFYHLVTTVFLIMSLFTACTADDHADDHNDLFLPDVEAVELNGRSLKVVTTTSLIHDVVSEISGDAILLTTLMGANTDSHSYEATPSDLVAMEEADIIFVNGWSLEEQVLSMIEDNFSEKTVAISAGIEPRTLNSSHDSHDESDESDHSDESGHDDHSGADPHVWFAIRHVKQWANNAETVLSGLDPVNIDLYQANLSDYLADLDALETEMTALITTLPLENRKLVTNHDAFGYFADEYDFEVVGTVIPGFSSRAEPAARDLARLVETMEEEAVCTIFAETSNSTALAETIVKELDHCSTVQLHPLYTGAVGTGEAGSYIGMFRSNVETIVGALE